MKKIQHTFVLLLAFTISTNTQAQLSGLLKKAEDKLKEKKVKKETKQEEKTETKTEVTNSKEETVKSVKDIATNSDPNLPDGYYLIQNDLGKIILANTAFGTTAPATTSQASFKSSDFIYGRIQLNSGTIKEALKIAEKDNKHPFYYYDYDLFIYKNKKEVYHNRIWNTILLRDDELNKDYLNFDILPDPKKVSSIYSATSDFCCGKSTVPLYSSVSPEVFATEGVYKVELLIRNSAIKDQWGKAITDESKWPTFDIDFDFTFNNNDIATLKKNYEAASTLAQEKFKTAGAMAAELPDSWTAKSGAPMAGYSAAKYNQLYVKYYPAAKIIKTYMTNDGGWSLIKDNDNILPRYKYSSQWVTYFVKNSNGECYYHTCNLRQNYEGGGRYSAAFLAVFDEEIKYLDCGKMK
jgi:hypothetical protein